MHWLYNACSIKSSHSDDGLSRGRQTRSKSSIFWRRGYRLQMLRKKARHLGKNGVDQSCLSSNVSEQPTSFRSTTSSGNSPLPEPQPLPLPRFQFLIKNNYVRIPSTNAIKSHMHPHGNIVCRHQDRGGARGYYNVPRAANGRCSYEEDRRNIEHYSTGLEYGGYNVHMSAPTSPFSSPRNLSPQRDRDGCGGKDTFTSQYVATPCFQVWSAPDTMSSSNVDLSNHGDPSFYHNGSVENDQLIVDGSPIPSILISPRMMGRSPSCPPEENYSVSRRESPSHGLPNMHPLPRPPTSSHSPLPHLSHTPEVVLVNSQWKKGKLIGRGTFGTVHVASNKETGALCAMKVVEMLPDNSNSAESIKQLEQEIKVLSNLKHPNIVQYYGSEIVGDQFNIYLEYVHPGSLTQFIKDHCGAITESVVRNFTRHILCGLAYLHSTKTIHRDIKGANLLVDAYGVVKLADFGMAKHLHGHKQSLSLKGSPYWMAPELLHLELHKDTSLDAAYAIDIWSLGCTVIEMLTGAPPWKEYEGAAAMFMVLKENPRLPDGLSEDGRDFLNQCFRRNPTERPTAVMLLEHRFIRGNHQPLEAPVNIAKRPPIVNDSLLSRRGHRLPMFSDTQIMQEKSAAEQHSDVSHQGNPKGSSMRMALHYSPRSILEGLPSLSPPTAGYEYIPSPVVKGDRTTTKP